jgi:DnaK suppressor protein
MRKRLSMTKKMNKKDKDQFRKLLADKKETITRKLTEAITESKEMESNVAQDLVDKAETSYTKEFLLSLSDGEREQLLHIDEALKRLEHGEFGTCQVCRKEIGPKRLLALPWTPLCIDCQEKAEEELKAQ